MHKNKLYKPITADEIEILKYNSDKPVSVNRKFNYNELDDRVFEILLYTLFKKKIEKKDKHVKKFANVSLMQGVGEKGMDCILSDGGKINGLIQCKRLKRNINSTDIYYEVIKFALHSLYEEQLIDNPKRFTYYFASSSGFTGDAIKSVINIKDSLTKTPTLIGDLVKKISSKYKSLNVDHDIKALEKILFDLKIELISPSDLDNWMFTFSDIINQFFEITKVTDNTLIEETRLALAQKMDRILEKDIIEDEANCKLFISTYKKISIEKLNVVNFIGYDLHRHRQRPTDIALTDLFVKPNFHEKVDNKNQLLLFKKLSTPKTELKIPAIFDNEKNIVILGDPGAGKSLLVKFIIVNILQGKADNIGLRKFSKYFPIRIELRKFSEKVDSKNIIEYIGEMLVNEYQIPKDIIGKMSFDHFFKDNYTLVFFDGLDEIFDIGLKVRVKEAIDIFAISYPKSKCVITSRFIGYHDVKFNNKNFCEFAISKFNHEHINELIVKFVKSQTQSDSKRKEREADFVQQISDVDDDLKSNPLILTLILILASNNLVIPDSKLEIYESCTNTLIDGLDDKVKGLKFSLPINNKRRTLGNLAYWQYKLQSSSETISYEKALKNIAEYLIEKGEFSNYDKAENAAKVFLEYAERRSIYFENNFTHKTFLEYFTADFIFIKYHTSQKIIERDRIISKYISNPFWSIVFELLIAKIDKDQESNTVLDALIEKQIRKSKLASNTLFFLIKNLSRIKNVSTPVRTKIIDASVYNILKQHNGRAHLSSGFLEENLLTQLFNLALNEKHLSIVQSVFTKIENELMEDESKTIFYIFYYEFVRFLVPSKKLKLTISNENEAKRLADTDISLFIHYYLKPDCDIYSVLKRQINIFGIESVFNDSDFRFLPNRMRIATIFSYLRVRIETLDLENLQKEYYQLNELGISQNRLLTYIKSVKGLYFTQPEATKKLLEMYNISKDENIDMMLLTIIKDARSFRTVYETVKSNFKGIKARKLLEMIRDSSSPQVRTR